MDLACSRSATRTGRWRKQVAIVLLLVLAAAASALGQARVAPDNTLTPGVLRALTDDEIRGTAWGRDARHVTGAMRREQTGVRAGAMTRVEKIHFDPNLSWTASLALSSSRSAPANVLAKSASISSAVIRLDYMQCAAPGKRAWRDATWRWFKNGVVLPRDYHLQ